MIKLNFKTLTPVHISNGNQLAYNLEYVIIGNELVKLNLNAHKIIAERKLFDFSKDYTNQKIIDTIEKNKNIFDESCFDYKIEVMESFEEFLSSESRDGRKIVQEFINSNGKFYVPASSVKGMLTTVLRREPQNNPLGIHPKFGNWKDRFIITDSKFIDQKNFVVDRAFRPPEINLIVLDTDVAFSSEIRALGNLKIEDLRKKLFSYSFNQLSKAEKIVRNFAQLERNPGGATQYLTFLEKILDEIKLGKDEYLVNLGFGGGSYYKIFSDVPIPKFKNPGRKFRKEEAHTTFAVKIENEFYQLGWCKLKIEED